METKIEVWHNKSSLRKTCVNIPRCIPPPSPLLQCWHHTSLVFFWFSCPPSIKPARAIYNIEPGRKGGMKCHTNVKCGTSISLSIYCLRVFLHEIQSSGFPNGHFASTEAKNGLFLPFAFVFFCFLLSSQRAHR